MPQDLGPQMMLAEWLFVETVEDIRRRSKNPNLTSRYKLLGIAPLLRKLLLDSRCLVDVVRTVRPGVSTEYRIRPWRPLNDGFGEQNLPYVIRLGADELAGDPDDPPLPDLPQFLKATVGETNGNALTIRDVVRYYAHVEGGVHFGVPKHGPEHTLSTMAPILLGHSTGQIEILAHIGAIVVDALTPLCNSILASPTIDTRMHRINESGLYENHWTSEFQMKVGGTTRSGPCHEEN